MSPGEQYRIRYFQYCRGDSRIRRDASREFRAASPIRLKNVKGFYNGKGKPPVLIDHRADVLKFLLDSYGGIEQTLPDDTIDILKLGLFIIRGLFAA
jgi:hypothetical protein